MKKNVGFQIILSLFAVLLTANLASAFNLNGTRRTNNFTTDIDWTNSVNVTLYNNNQTLRCNTSDNGIAYIALNETMTINATRITPYFAFNDSTRGSVNFSINGGKNFYNNVTNGTTLAWNHTGQPTNLLVRVNLNCINTLVDFNGLNLTYQINTTTTAIGNINTKHRNTTGIGYFAFLNATTNTSVNPQPVVYTTNDTTSTITINSTGAMSLYDNVTNSGWYSLNACATLLETQSCQAFILNLSNDPFRALSANLSPSADPPENQPVNCTVGGADDDNDQIDKAYRNWYIDNVLQSPASITNSNFNPIGNAGKILICELVAIFDGKANSTGRVNATAVRIKEVNQGGGGIGGSYIALPVEEPAQRPLPPISTTPPSQPVSLPAQGPSTFDRISTAFSQIFTGDIGDGFTALLNALFDSVGIKHN